MMGVSPFSRILLVSACVASLLACSVVFEMSKRESTSDRFPECWFPRISTGVF